MRWAPYVAAAALFCTGPGSVWADGTEEVSAGGLRLFGGESDWTFRPGAKVHLDVATYRDDRTELEDDAVWRRVRPQLGIRIGDRWSLKGDYDFGSVSDGWKNAWIQYRFSADWDVRAGNQVVLLGLDEIMSSDDLMLMERPLASLFTPSFLTGMALRGDNQDMSFSLGWFANDLRDDDRRSLDGRSIVGRVTWAPVRSPDRLLHLGVAAEFRDPQSGEEVRFRTRPESAVTDARLVDTRTIDDTRDVRVLGTELVWAAGPLQLQAEYLASQVRRSGAERVTFDGWYVAASTVVNGRRRGYRTHTGSLGDVRPPRRGWGALELVARYGGVDLTDADVTGGRQKNLALGINWYPPLRAVRVMVNYIHMDAEPNRNEDDETASALQARLQVSF